MCERQRQDANRGAHGDGFVLFPEKVVFKGRGVGFGKGEIAKKTFTLPGGSSKGVRAALVGCVDYRFTFDPKVHVTGFAYWIYSAKGQKDLLPVDEMLPLDSISLQPYEWADGYID